MVELGPRERVEERRSMAERAVGGLGILKQRRPVELEDLSRTLAGFLVARFFKVQRTGGFENTQFEEAEIARALAWQGYLEDAEAGQELPRIIKDPKVLAELSTSVWAFLDALEASPEVDSEAKTALREALEGDCPAALPSMLANLAQAIRELP